MKLNRLVKLNDIKTYHCEAADGQIGSSEDMYFDDRCLAIRFLIVNSKQWLRGRKVILSPFTIGAIDEQNQLVYIELTQQQIKNSPPLGADQPVSRQYEKEYFKYYDWPPYWDYLSWPNTSPLRTSVLAVFQPSHETSSRPENHLHRASQILDFSVVTMEGQIGQLKDLIIDTYYWIIRYLEIDTRNWLSNKDYILITPARIIGINRPENHICVDLNRDTLQNIPSYDANKPISREYESHLLRGYGEKLYWK